MKRNRCRYCGVSDPAGLRFDRSYLGESNYVCRSIDSCVDRLKRFAQKQKFEVKQSTQAPIQNPNGGERKNEGTTTNSDTDCGCPVGPSGSANANQANAQGCGIRPHTAAMSAALLGDKQTNIPERRGRVRQISTEFLSGGVESRHAICAEVRHHSRVGSGVAGVATGS